MNFDRPWTQFALEAENDEFGFTRIAKAHNDLDLAARQAQTLAQSLQADLSMSTAEIARLGKEVDALKAELAELRAIKTEVRP
jgi:uncharacterized protein YdcH (DUF465 family)